MSTITSRFEPNALNSAPFAQPQCPAGPGVRVHCPACGKRLVLPANFASRSGSAPCPRCAKPVHWTGNREFARAWEKAQCQIDSPDPQSPDATLVLNRDVVAAELVREPKTPPLPLPFPEPPPVQRPATKSVNQPATPASLITSTQAQRTPTAQRPAETKSASELATESNMNSTVRAAGTQSLTISWLIVCMVGLSGMLSLMGLVVTIVLLNSRPAPALSAASTGRDQPMLTPVHLELEQARHFKQQLECEIEELKNESQSLQVEIERLKKDVL